MSHARSILKPALLALLVAAVTVTSAEARASVSARGQNNRLRFSCAAAAIIESAAYSVAGVIDWRGDQGQATVVVMRQAYDRRSYYGGYGYGGYGPAPAKAKELKLKVALKDDGVNQVIRQKDGNANYDLKIVWRSDLPREVPREAYFTHGGVKFPLANCRAVVKKRQKDEDGEPTGRYEEDQVDPEDDDRQDSRSSGVSHFWR